MNIYAGAVPGGWLTSRGTPYQEEHLAFLFSLSHLVKKIVQLVSKLEYVKVHPSSKIPLPKTMNLCKSENFIYSHIPSISHTPSAKWGVRNLRNFLALA